VAKKIYLDDESKGGQPNWLHEARRLRREKELKMKYDKKYYDFLDGLRETGKTNMFGATPYLLNQFHELDEALAKKILVDWMKTFSKRHPRKESEND